MEIWCEDWQRVSAYRFSRRMLEFLICRDCGVYVAAVWSSSNGPLATLNVHCLDDRSRFIKSPEIMNYEGENIEARNARRASRFTPVSIYR